MDIQKVKKITLSDGCLYTGDTIVVSGEYVPEGWGMKVLPHVESYTGIFEDGMPNGLSYYNRQDDMFLGYFKKETKTMNGWGLTMGFGEFKFGVWEYSKLRHDLTEQVNWMMYKMMEQNYQKSFINVFPGVNEILFGIPGKTYERTISLYFGFHFMSNGEVFVGTCSGGGVEKTGEFIHYKFDGTISVGEFEKGVLIRQMDIQEILDNYLGVDDSATEEGRRLSKKFNMFTDHFPRIVERRRYHEVKVDTSKKYF